MATGVRGGFAEGALGIFFFLIQIFILVFDDVLGYCAVEVFLYSFFLLFFHSFILPFFVI